MLANGRKTRLLSRHGDASDNVLGPNAPAMSRTGSQTRASISGSLPASRLALREFTLYSLLYRGQGGKVTPLLRSFGTP